jgi:hypothetical protein
MENPRKEVMEIGHNSLFVIAFMQDTDVSRGRLIGIDSKLLGFKIARFDANENVVDKQVVTFEGENASGIANFLSGAIQDLLERSYLDNVQMGSSSITVSRLDDGSALIKSGSSSIEVIQEDMGVLADKLAYVVAMSKVTSGIGQ